ncbi:von Willebrand factor type A domain-containing protein [Maribacter orientalis]|uniref:von Willebrand factor type A domain-containing protein n=1 Tax=Maribacter orientalis TaxID=228957 RepID=A0A1H7QT40_9FLAO|nr:VWA domain-containing protein [Maribacter orientalis]SEL51180.1 von Willebrand factor type A domain-containing protein [Maribacter orientalis]
MKTLKKITTSGLLLFGISTVLGCVDEPKQKQIELIAHAHSPLEIKKDNIVQIALLLDTSNSMDGLINQAKSQLWDIVNEFSLAKWGNDARPNLQIALYQYGNDNLSADEGYIQQVLGFSSDLDEISEKLFLLTTNGGEEYCGKVLQASLAQLPWNKNPDLLRMIFIAGNEPFDQGQYNYKTALTNANEKDVVVNTIFCGNYDLGINTNWKNGATLTGGEYMAIDHNKEVVQITTPYDEIIIKLNSRLNKTYISYGSLGKSKYIAQEVQDRNALSMQEAVAVKRAVSKSSRLYNNKKWDLVDAYDDAEFEISSIEKDELPEELQSKSENEIKKFVESKKNEREEIQKEIKKYNSKRLTYITENQKNNNSGELENAMIQAIKKQAASKNYRWD